MTQQRPSIVPRIPSGRKRQPADYAARPMQAVLPTSAPCLLVAPAEAGKLTLQMKVLPPRSLHRCELSQPKRGHELQDIHNLNAIFVSHLGSKFFIIFQIIVFSYKVVSLTSNGHI